ncbi:mitochondrial [Durusdinium trenchii]|uniref:Mitochondrial n=1 Tax=Durusdinium trenchii TaxID=1381693 RepID=A0ABP0LAX1_9DINO
MQFDCSGTEADWSSDKKNWCCKEHNRGCDVAEPYDCRAGVTNWQNGWSDHKKYWCCNKYDVACPNPVVFDCDAGYSNWQRTWSADKKARSRWPSASWLRHPSAFRL